MLWCNLLFCVFFAYLALNTNSLKKHYKSKSFASIAITNVLARYLPYRREIETDLRIHYDYSLLNGYLHLTELFKPLLNWSYCWYLLFNSIIFHKARALNLWTYLLQCQYYKLAQFVEVDNQILYSLQTCIWYFVRLVCTNNDFYKVSI